MSIANSVNGFLDLPLRPAKPRETGITHVMDKGMTQTQIEGLMETAGDYVDIVKLGWGTAVVTPNVKEKIALYQSFGIPVCFGGTFFEVCLRQGKLEEYVAWAKDIGVDHLEVSDGTIQLDHAEKIRVIERLAKDFTVLSEVGSKSEDVIFAPKRWVAMIEKELEAGAWKVITEGREGGTAGIFRSDGDMRTGLIDEIAHEIAVDDLIFEAPTKSSQAWFVKQFGPNVNLGNIPPDEVIPLETLRLGLRGDTLKEILLAPEPAV